jgi:hypothetical protein
MPRSLPIGLTDALGRAYSNIETHSTLQLSLPSDLAPTLEYFFATAALTIDGVRYERHLRDTGAVRTSLTRSADRVTADLQNVDGILGVDLIYLADALYGAAARFGRYWRDDSGAEFHKVLLTGVIAGVEINDQVVRLTLVSDTYAAVSVGASRRVAKDCQWATSGGFRGPQCGYAGAELTCNYLLNDTGGCEGRHGTPLKRAKFGGFVYLESKQTVSSAAALPLPAANQLLKVGATAYAQQPIVKFTGVSITDDAPNKTTNVVVTGSAMNVRQALNVKLDYGAVGDGIANDTTAIQNALTDAAAATGKIVYLPAGTYLVISTLTVPGGVTMVGDGPEKTIITSTTNAIIVNAVEGAGAYAFKGPRIRDLQIKGSKTAGTSQIGLNIDDETYMAHVEVSNVRILTCGSHGLYVGNAFSSRFLDIFSSDHNGYPFLINSANMPALHFESCYAGDVNAGFLAGYRIRAGNIAFVSCNGINSSAAGSWWAIIGDKVGVDGAASNRAAFCHWQDCNIESSKAGGVLHYFNSVSEFSGLTQFAGDGSGSGSYIALKYEVDSSIFPPFFSKGRIGDRAIFANSPASYYSQSLPIHANDTPPLMLDGQGPKIAGGSFQTTYYDTTNAKAEPLYRADSYLPIFTATGTTTFNRPGVRMIECNFSAPGTITIPWAGWEAPGGSFLIVKDVANNAATHNITINTLSGGTINGASSYTLNRNGQAVLLVPNQSGAGDWRVIATSPPAAGVDFTGGGKTDFLARWVDDDTITAAQAYYIGNILVLKNGLIAESDNTHDWGGSGNAPRDIWVGRRVITPKVEIGSGGATLVGGAGDPEGAVAAEPGSIYLRTNGNWYKKISGSGNTGWQLQTSGGTPTLTATYVGFGDGSNLLTGSSRMTFIDASNPILTIDAGSFVGLVHVKGTDSRTRVQLDTGAIPGNQGGLILPYAGSAQGNGPGIWWSNGNYADTVRLALAGGLTYQGDAGNAGFIIRKSTDTSSDGDTVFILNPNDGYLLLDPFGTGAGNTTEIRMRELAANGSSYVGLKAPDSLAGTIVFVLPSALPGDSDRPIVSSSAGALSAAIKARLDQAIGGGATPTLSTGTGAGTGPTTSTDGTQLACFVSVTTGTAPASGAKVFDLTFANMSPNYYVGVLVPVNAAAAALSGAKLPFISDADAANNKLTIKAGSTALDASTTYDWYVIAIAI